MSRHKPGLLRGQAGGPSYVMGFTGHWLSILLFTLFSLAKCRRVFFLLDCEKVKQGHLQPSSIQTWRGLAAAFSAAAILIYNCAHGNLGETQKLDS